MKPNEEVSTDKFDLVEIALQHMPTDVIHQLAREALIGVARKALPPHVDNVSDAYNRVAETLQRRMPAVNANEFARQLMEIAGIDARKSVSTRAPFNPTLEGIARFVESRKQNDRNRRA